MFLRATSKMSLPTRQSLMFDTICKIAADLDGEGLARFIDQEGIFVDFPQGIVTPILYLARAGKHQAVDLLLRHFDADINAAVKGYAIGGFFSEVEMLRKRGAQAAFAVEGYAVAGNIKQVKWLQAQREMLRHIVQESRLRLGLLDDAVLKGYAEGNFHQYIAEILEKNPAPGLVAWQRFLCESYAQAGNVHEAFNIFHRHAGIELTTLLKGCSIGGFDVTAFLDNEEKTIITAICGYIQGGRYDQAALLVTSSRAFASGINALAKMRYINKVNELMTLPILDNANLEAQTIEEASNGYKRHSASEKELSRIIRLTNHLALKENLSTHVSNDALNRISNIEKLMKENHMSYPLAEAWSEVFQVLFYESAAFITRHKLPVATYLLITTYLTGFPEQWTLSFINRYRAFPQTQQNWPSIGRYQLIARQSFFNHLPPHFNEMGLAEAKLEKLLRDYAQKNISGSKEECVMVEQLKALLFPALNDVIVDTTINHLQPELDAFSYAEIYTIIAPLHNSSAKCSEAATQLLQELRQHFESNILNIPRPF